MMKRSMAKVLGLALVLPVLATAALQQLFAQQEEASQTGLQLPAYTLTIPWAEGTHGDAMFQSAVGSTIPMSTYSFAATKNGKTYTGTLVGTSPFATTLMGSSIPVVVVPVKVTIGKTVFDPTAANSCDGGVSTLTRFSQSPLVENSSLTFNGVNVGTTQYVNGFQRAEFWTKIGGSAAYQNTLVFSNAAEVSVTETGSLYSSGCTQLGIVGYSAFANYLSSEIAALTKSGVISPTKFVIFLVKNIVQSTANPPSTSGCCILGFHTAQGSPVQTWGVMDWDTTGDFGTGVADGSISSHEIGEWMDDPLGTNPTPAWGGIGQVSGCQTNWEVGDPLSGSLMPGITLTGKTYHMQELGFFSWYFNKLGVASTGAAGKFSSNGTFAGPSKACPPGGTN